MPHNRRTNATDTILIAEDDPVSRMILEKMLKNLDYETVSAGDGREAFDILQQRDIRFVITDWMMPCVDGIQLCRTIRSATLPGYVYVIFLTALDDKAHLVEALEAGADDYLTKPIDPQELRVRVRSGQRVIDLDRKLQTRAEELETLADLVSSARYHVESVIDSVGQGIITVDNEGIVHSVNHEAGRLLGEESTKLVGWNLREGHKRFEVLAEFAFSPGEYPRDTILREGDLTVEVWAFRIRPIDASRGLIITLTDVTERDRMQREIEAANRRLQELAVTDVMTQLANHRRFQEEIARHLLLAKRASRDLSLLMLDVDHFKAYNDKFGHPAGDKMLALLADVLRAEVRETDIPARYGGEEFAVILVETDMAHAIVVAERIRRSMETASASSSPAVVTVSIGIASFPDNGSEPSDLINAADEALYAAKAAGRNTVRTSADARSAPRFRDAG